MNNEWYIKSANCELRYGGSAVNRDYTWALWQCDRAHWQIGLCVVIEWNIVCIWIVAVNARLTARIFNEEQINGLNLQLSRRPADQSLIMTVFMHKSCLIWTRCALLMQFAAYTLARTLRPFAHWHMQIDEYRHIHHSRIDLEDMSERLLTPFRVDVVGSSDF